MLTRKSIEALNTYGQYYQTPLKMTGSSLTRPNSFCWITPDWTWTLVNASKDNGAKVSNLAASDVDELRLKFQRSDRYGDR